MQFIDIEVTVGFVDITLSCGVVNGTVEKVTGFIGGKRNPRLQRWAERYVNSSEGSDQISDACADAGIGLWNGRPW